jgi:pyruvate dehydrogenase E1 component alpha subunit
MDNKTVISVFRKILLIRRVEEKIAELYPEQEMRCPVHLSIGQEATAAGVSENLSKGDIVFSSHRSHAHYLAKGGNIDALIAEFYGKSTGCSKGRGGSMHLVDLSVDFYGSTSIVAGTIPVAVGAAFGKTMQNKESIVVVFFGEGAAEQGLFHESLNFAALKKLPILFVCENNLYAVYSHISKRQPDRPITDLVKSYGIESYQEDGNDAIKVYEAANKAIKRVKSGKGPVFIEFSTYRWMEHCGPNYDNDIGYRSEEEFLKWKKRCPLEMFKKKLLLDGIMTTDQINEMEEKVKTKIDSAVQFAKNSPFPKKETLREYIYSK